MAFSGVKKQKKNELTVRSGSNPKKKGKRTLITFSKVKKKKKKKKKKKEDVNYAPQK